MVVPVTKPLRKTRGALTPQFTGISCTSNGSVTLTGSGGGPNLGYTLRVASIPSAAWVVLSTNHFSATGSCTNTDNTATIQSMRFYRISVP